MELRWTGDAADDLERITEYLFKHAPDRAARIVRAIYDAPTALLTLPNRGRLGKKVGTRELVLPSLPYIIIYQISGDVIHILRILHAAQQWP
jgi:toxin ParE1/3/4